MWYVIFIATRITYGIEERDHYSSVCVELDEIRAPWYLLTCVPAVTKHLADQSALRPVNRKTLEFMGSAPTHAITGMLPLASREQAAEWEKPEDPYVIERAWERQRMSANREKMIAACKTPEEREKMTKCNQYALDLFDQDTKARRSSWDSLTFRKL
jgi:hypothetical protein